MTIEKGILKSALVRELLLRKKSVVLVFILSLLNAVFETMGLGLVLPFLHFVVNGKMHPLVKTIYDIFSNCVISVNEISFILILLFIIQLMKSAMSILSSKVVAEFSWGLARDWSKQSFKNYINSELSFYKTKRIGSIINDIISEPEVAANAIIKAVLLVTSFLLCIFLICSLFLINWKITLIIFTLGAVLVGGSSYGLKNFASRIGKEKIQTMRDLNSRASEALTNMFLVKSLGLEKFELDKFNFLNDKLLKNKVRNFYISQTISPLVEFFVIVLIIMAIGLMTGNDITSLRTFLPTITVVVLISQKIFTQASTIIVQTNYLRTTFPSINLILASLKDIPLEDKYQGDELKSVATDIIFSNVDFGYEKEIKILNNFNQVIKKGQINLIIGGSGKGKSSLVSLIVGMYRNYEGSIKINDREIKEFNLLSIRNKIGLVGQEPMLMNDSIKVNVTCEDSMFNELQYQKSLELSALTDFVKSLKQGDLTCVGERGSSLSGGQKQRIALARVIYKNPEVFIFDEVTSALDSQTIDIIRDSIYKLKENGKTIIVISHDNGFISNPDHKIEL